MFADGDTDRQADCYTIASHQEQVEDLSREMGDEFEWKERKKDGEGTSMSSCTD